MKALRGESLLREKTKRLRRREVLLISEEWYSLGQCCREVNPEQRQLVPFGDQEVIRDVQERKSCWGRSQTAKA